MQEGLEGFEEVAEGKELISTVNCEDVLSSWRLLWYQT